MIHLHERGKNTQINYFFKADLTKEMMMYRKENFITGMTYFPEIRSQRRKEKKPYQMRNVLGNKTPDEIRELCRL